MKTRGSRCFALLWAWTFLLMENVWSADITPPNVAIRSLRAGDLVGGTMTVTADASDDDAVARVSFFKDGAADRDRYIGAVHCHG